MRTPHDRYSITESRPRFIRTARAPRRGVASLELLAYLPLVILCFALIWQVLTMAFQSMASHVSAYQGAFSTTEQAPDGTTVASQSLGGKPGLVALSSRDYAWKHPWVSKTPVALEFDAALAVSAPPTPEKPEHSRQPLQVPAWSNVYQGKEVHRALSDIASLGRH